MNLAELGKTIIQYGAPLLGTAIAGPAGTAIGQIVAHEFGGSINEPEKLIDKITNDPTASVKLAEIQSNTKIEIQKLIITAEENELKYETQQIGLSDQNTADARASNLKSNSIYPQFLSTIIILGFYICIYWIAAFSQDKADHDVLYMLLGVMGTAFGAVVNYWLGNSFEKKK